MDNSDEKLAREEYPSLKIFVFFCVHVCVRVCVCVCVGGGGGGGGGIWGH